MTARKTISKKSDGSASKVNGRNVKTTAASALTQATLPRSERTERSRSRRTTSSADELGLRAWKTTYKNSHNNGEA